MGESAVEIEVTFVRQRSLATLSLAALSALALAGCGSSGEPDAEGTATPEPTAAAEAPENLCDAAAPSGDVIDQVDVSGKFGEEAEVSFDAPLEFDEFERSVVTEGEGDELEDGAYIHYAATVFDASTGEKLGAEGYGDVKNVPVLVQSANAFGAAFGCASPGTRVAFTFPGQTSADGQEIPAQVYVLDYLSDVPTRAWGEEQDPVEGLPTVELAEDGTPSISVPEGYAEPDETQIAVLKKGDGPEVQEGDAVISQYMGVKASDGTEFDSSWSRGTPMKPTLPSGLVEGFQKALVGHTVGSQVLAVIPPSEGYGATEGHELQNETLVFVVDILDATPVPTAE